jgi:hypothetical protein
MIRYLHHDRTQKATNVPHGETLNHQFRLHLYRGISYLTTPNKIRGIDDLIQLAARNEGTTDGTDEHG